MAELKDIIQSADWKQEKHAPVIEAPETVRKGDAITIKASIGAAIAHPNTTAHHIAWIELFFLPDGEKFPYQLTRAEFNAHGASAQGADTSTIYTNPDVTVSFKTEKSGTLIGLSSCNIHGLWQASKTLRVE